MVTFGLFVTIVGAATLAAGFVKIVELMEEKTK